MRLFAQVRSNDGLAPDLRLLWRVVKRLAALSAKVLTVKCSVHKGTNIDARVAAGKARDPISLDMLGMF